MLLRTVALGGAGLRMRLLPEPLSILQVTVNNTVLFQRGAARSDICPIISLARSRPIAVWRNLLNENWVSYSPHYNSDHILSELCWMWRTSQCPEAMNTQITFYDHLLHKFLMSCTLACLSLALFCTLKPLVTSGTSSNVLCGGEGAEWGDERRFRQTIQWQRHRDM